MKTRFTLFSKILFWFFLSLVVLGGVLYGFFNFQFRLGPRSPFRGEMGDRVHVTAQMILRELRQTPQDQWNAIFLNYNEAYGVDFFLVSIEGSLLAGNPLQLPDKVKQELAHHPPADHPPPPPPPHHGLRPPPEAAHPPRKGPMPLRPENRFSVRTTHPTRYWVGMRFPLFVNQGQPPIRAALLIGSDSMTGNGLFLDPGPWVLIALAVIVLSALLWVPMVRNITRPIGQVTAAAQRIAQGHFDVKLDVVRNDEIGQLGRSINEMATRIDGLVKGQKRFLGDVSHELASPIARIKLGLGILEQNLVDADKDRVMDVIDEMERLSDLVNELLSFSRAEINPAKIRLEPVPLYALARRIAKREAPKEQDFLLEIDEELKVNADPELLARALANLLRNALRYAGDAGPICVAARKQGGQVIIEVRDQGLGVPESTLGHLFEPFFRPDGSRGSQTGGVGLGLAIVKTCIQSCGGTVSAKNLTPAGFAVILQLPLNG